LIEEVSLIIKENQGAVQPPPESIFWKTGWFKEFPPVNPDFWYIRAASMLRKLYRKPIGVNRFEKIYGGRSPGRVHKKHSARGSGKIIRLILQQLEEDGYVIKSKRMGRKLTNEGRSLLDKSAAKILMQGKA
jgi:small subunit ribosomal protein S19e